MNFNRSGIVTIGSEATRTSGQGSVQTDPLLQQLQLLQHDAPVASSSQAEPFWQGLTSFVTSTKADEGEGLELDAAPLARLLQTYKDWCGSQAAAVQVGQGVVNRKITEVDLLSSNILAQVQKQQKAADSAAAQLKDMAGLQQQMEGLSAAVHRCHARLQALQHRELSHH